jgi:hypothetical protein
LGKKRTTLTTLSTFPAGVLLDWAVVAVVIKRIQAIMVIIRFNETNLVLLFANYKLFLTFLENERVEARTPTHLHLGKKLSSAQPTAC